MKIDYSLYRRKVEACWLGKSVGGTLGGPDEGNPGPLSLSFYDPVPTEMLPNDDLDLQVVWHEKIRQTGLPVNSRDLADAWLENIQLYPDEYGVAVRNLTKGIYPPLSGWWDNKFTAGMGAAIRTELWACLAPGDPDLAVRLAEEDARVDHAGEGVFAPVFLAAMESLAFVENRPEQLLDKALAYLPEKSRLARGVSHTRRWVGEGRVWGEVRSLILDKYAVQNWTDVVPNLCFIVLGLLLFEEEGFDKALCTAVNCGLDTDCTGATLGALLGIMDPRCIGNKWLEPIGKKMVLSPGMTGLRYPDNLDDFSDEVAQTAVNILDYYESSVRLEGAPWDSRSLPRRLPLSRVPSIETPSTTALLSLLPVTARLDYRGAPSFAPGETRDLRLTLTNPQDSVLDLEIHARAPRGWLVNGDKSSVTLQPGESTPVTLGVTAPGKDALRTYLNDLVLHLSANGMAFLLKAGLAQSFPWRIQSRSETAILENKFHYWIASPGESVYETEIKIPWKGNFMFVSQGLGRKIRTYLDGELINDYDGSFYVPAVHRNLTGTAREVDRGWHRIRLEVSDGPESELFFDLGVAGNWSLLTTMEWRLSPYTAFSAG